MEKKEIRKDIKQQRLSISVPDKEMFAQAVFARLENTEEFRNSQNLLLYYALPDELPTHEFIKKWSNNKKIYLPRVNGEDLKILEYVPDGLSIGAFNIEEPTGDVLVDCSIIDLIIVPAVAFDKNCNRLGRGKGYYDRLLSKSDAIKIGVGYDFQIVKTLPVEPHDVPMDCVITPKEIIRRK